MIDKNTPIGTRVRVCQHQGDGGNWRDLGHDHDNPAHHWNSRLVGWNRMQGLPMIATLCSHNPHCCEWTYTPESLTVIEDGEDWVDKSLFKIGLQVEFFYELIGFHGMEVGKITPATLECPHIKQGDWIVRYPRHDNGSLIIRVLNESQMHFPCSLPVGFFFKYEESHA